MQACTTLYESQGQYSYRPPLPPVKRPKIALVLGGGGARGLAHVGVLEVLLQNGIQPDLIVGCSAGAIVGALYADHLNIHHVKQTLIKKKREHLIDFSLFHLPFGVSNGDSLGKFLRTELRAQTFEELKIPFIAVATNLQFGDLAAFGTGPLELPIRASAAYPGFFVPVRIHEQYFVDGGVIDPVPVYIARKLGAQFVIAVDLSGNLEKAAPTNLMGVVKRSLEISYIHQSHLLSNEADFVFHLPFSKVNTFEDDLNGYIYEVGYKTAKAHIGQLKQKLKKST